SVNDKSRSVNPMPLLEHDSGRDLEGARSAGSKGLTNPLVRMAEHARVAEEVVVEVRHVAGVEDIECFTDKAKLIAFAEFERFAHTKVLRIVDIPKVEVLECRNLGIFLSGGRQCSCNRRVVLIDQIPETAVADEAAVALAKERQEGCVSRAGHVGSRVIDPVNGRSHRGMALHGGDQRDLESPGQIDKPGNVQVVVRLVRAIAREEVTQVLSNVLNALAALQCIRGGELETVRE